MGKRDKARERRMQRRREARESGRRAQRERGGSSYFRLPAGVEVAKFEKGRTEIDAIMYPVTSEHNLGDKRVPVGEMCDYILVDVHRNIGQEQKRVVCLKNFNKPCPICEERVASRDDEDKWKALGVSRRFLMNIVVDGKVQVMEFSDYNFGQLLEKEIDDGEDDWIAFAESEGGYTLRVRFGEDSMGGNITFLVAERIDFKRREDIDESLLEQAVDLDKALIVYDYDKLKAIFYGEDIEEEEDNPFTSEKEPETEDDPDPEPEPEPESEDIDSCPYDHNWGKDCDETDDCEDCKDDNPDHYDACADEFERLEKEKAKAKEKNKTGRGSRRRK